MKLDIDRIIAYEKDGRLRVQKHPDRPLFIANYTEKVQWERLWDDLTIVCRGLVFEDDGTIVGRPLRKFFNMGEPCAPPTPDEPFEVTEKVDGSLIIAYYDPAQGGWDVASRGSFASDHANEARALWHEKAVPGQPGRTYCLELIAPWNRIVVNYGDTRDLVLLAVIDNETGLDLPLEDIGFPVAIPQGPYRSFHEFIESLPTKAARDDLRQRIRGTVVGVSALPLLQARDAGALLENPKGGCSPVSAAESCSGGTSQSEGIRDTPEYYRSGQSPALHGLQETVPAVCDGFRPQAGGDQAVSGGTGHAQPQGDGARDSQVRRGMRQLPQAQDVEEGYVIRFQSGLRLKLKFSEYLRIHRLVTGVNSRRVWEVLASGGSLSEMLDRVPEEFAEWVDVVVTDLRAQHASTTWHAKDTFERIRREAVHAVGLSDASVMGSMGMRREVRKAFATLVVEHKAISGLLFTLFDGGDIDAVVWKMLRPEAETPYASAG